MTLPGTDHIKKLVYISVESIKGQSFLHFETEAYDDEIHRLGYTDVKFESFEIKKALKKERLLEFGFMLAVGFVPGYFYENGEETRLGLVVYTNSDAKNPEIFIDEETYRTNPLRQLQSSMNLNNVPVDKICRDKLLYMAMAETVLRLLLPDVPFDSAYLKKRTFEK